MNEVSNMSRSLASILACDHDSTWVSYKPVSPKCVPRGLLGPFFSGSSTELALVRVVGHGRVHTAHHRCHHRPWSARGLVLVTM